MGHYSILYNILFLRTQAPQSAIDPLLRILSFFHLTHNFFLVGPLIGKKVKVGRFLVLI